MIKMVKYRAASMAGPIAPYVSGVRDVLADQGYAKSTSQQLIALLGRLSRWLDREKLGTESLSEDVLQRFLDELAGQETWLHPTAATFAVALAYLRGLGVVPEPAPATSVEGEEEALRHRFEHYLSQGRGLGAKSVQDHGRIATSFLAWLHDRGTDLDRMGVPDVVAFSTRAYESRPASGAKKELTGLRSFLRWAYLEELTTRSWAEAVPSAAAHGASLPRGLKQDELEALLDSCDTTTRTGLRDRAILVLMGRLGLRSHEVASLLLKDVNWRAGEVTIKGKGHCLEMLPLPHDVGSAVADYLRCARNPGRGESLFLRVHAPLHGLTASGVSEVVLAAGKRAGLHDVHAHRLRHTAATRLLRAGGSWSEVGQVLRHRSPASTARYAKVDEAALSCASRGMTLRSRAA